MAKTDFTFRESSTADALRADIDRGRTGEKVDFPDPAAAPLGADEEAAGTPLDERRVSMASREEVRGPVTAANRDGGPGAAWILMGVVIASAAAGVAAWWVLAGP